MNRSVVTMLTVCAATAFAAFGAGDLTPGPDGLIRNPDGSLRILTQAERKSLPKDVQRAMGMEMIRTIYGPRIEKPNSAKGYFKFVNCSKLVKPEDFEAAIKPIVKFTMIRLDAVAGEAPTPISAKDTMKKLGANAAVFVVDSDSLPRIMLAPEDGWGFVNAAALNSDKTSQSNLVRRVNTELLRAFMMICGSATDARIPVMGAVSSLSDIDAIKAPSFLPTNMKQTVRQLSLFGIEPRVVATYKKACEQGWAYTPTNDVEKAIWKKVHELPTKPLKIEYNEKRDKGK